MEKELAINTFGVAFPGWSAWTTDREFWKSSAPITYMTLQGLFLTGKIGDEVAILINNEDKDVFVDVALRVVNSLTYDYRVMVAYKIDFKSIYQSREGSFGVSWLHEFLETMEVRYEEVEELMKPDDWMKPF